MALHPRQDANEEHQPAKWSTSKGTNHPSAGTNHPCEHGKSETTSQPADERCHASRRRADASKRTPHQEQNAIPSVPATKDDLLRGKPCESSDFEQSRCPIDGPTKSRVRDPCRSEST